MSLRRTIGRNALITCTGLAAVLAASAVHADNDAYSTPLAKSPDQIKYAPVPGYLPGADTAMILGDLYQKGMYVMRNKFPPRYVLTPHKHVEWRLITVLEGTLYFAYGDTLDPAAAKAYGPGSVILEPKGVFHYLGTKESPATIQIVAEGPLTTIMSTKPLPKPPGAPPDAGAPAPGKDAKPAAPATSAPAPATKKPG